MSKEIAEDYASSLADLTVNSKPFINMLTILAEENVEHAGVIVETVEKHLEKVPSDIKLPVLYLVDSIIKNVGGAYATKFAEKIVNMFTKTFKVVDEKTRSQMFKLRETWHEVFPTTKLYQLDVKVNMIDPAWPIQAQTPQATSIHNAPRAPEVASTSTVPVGTDEEEKMRAILAKKEQELLMLQKQKVEMELEQTRRQYAELAGIGNNIVPVPMAPSVFPPSMPVAMVNPVVTQTAVPEPAILPVKQRLGPPVNRTAGGRIAPISGALLSARRDPRLARLQPPAPAPAPQPPSIAPNVFDIKPLDRPTKRKNFVTIDVPTDQIRRRDPRLLKTKDNKRRDERKKEEQRKWRDDKNNEDKIDANNFDIKSSPKKAVDDYINRIADPKKISKLPPIPKLSRNEDAKGEAAPSAKRRKDVIRGDKKKKRDSNSSDSNTSPEKKNRVTKEVKETRKKQKEVSMEVEDKPETNNVPFKELKNYHKERYMRRNKEKSESPDKVAESPEPTALQTETSSAPEIIAESKDVDLRVLHPIVEAKAAAVGQKRVSTETIESKSKKSKHDKFDILFGNEDVDLRQLPSVDDHNGVTAAESPKSDSKVTEKSPTSVPSPQQSPKEKDWNDVKDKTPNEGAKALSDLEVVRAKLAEATKGKDRLGRRLLFTKSPSLERERRRTISTEDTDLRPDPEEEVNKETISMILTQGKELFSDGKMDKNQYNTLMFQVMQLNERLKLKEAKQRESLEMSKRKLHKTKITDSDSGDHNHFGDIDERVVPSNVMAPPNQDSAMTDLQDFDMRVGPTEMDGHGRGLRPLPMPPMFMGPGNFPPMPMWRPMRPRGDDFPAPRRPRPPVPPYYWNKMDKRAPRPPFDARFGPPAPPKLGTLQGDYPLPPYTRSQSPPPLGAPGQVIPPTDFRVIEYIDQDPMKTIEIDGVPREIRFYGETAMIMLDWDDPREIKFLPGARRITFDNKDSVVLDFNDEYKKVEIDDQVFDIRFGAPTRELYINGRWYECFFGAPPAALMIDGKPRMIQLDGPPPQVDIGKMKRTDLVAGKINLIVDAQHMFPVFLDHKVQKFLINNHYYTIRFVDSLKTVLINEVPFKVEFGGLPKPLTIGQTRHFIRFSVLPKNVKPGQIVIANMEGSTPESEVVVPKTELKSESEVKAMETGEEEVPRPQNILSPDAESNHGGLDMLASVMPSSMAPASSFSGYSLAEPLFAKPEAGIPGLETQPEENQASAPLLGSINVNDLFAKLVATGIVQVPDKKPEVNKEEKKSKPREDKNTVHTVDLMKSETLRRKQPGIVTALYGGMQCSGCGARFPPEHTTRYSQHLDWHFRQNRRERDSARRAHSRHWHYDLCDWVQYEEVEDLEEREKSWFETSAETETAPLPAAPAAAPPSVRAGAPADQHCALCGDRFHQFYNEDKDEWHLRNSMRFEDNNYHPLCCEDYKASLAKEVPSKEEAQLESIEKDEVEAIEIKDADDTSQMSDNDDVVEVVEADKDSQEALEIDEGDEDDVIYKAEPVEEVTVDDDADTDDELAAERAERDRQFDFSKVKVKMEPVDPDDEPVITAEEEAIRTKPDSTSVTVLSSIDGNVQLEATPQITPNIPPGGIRINISKSIPTFITNHAAEDKMFEDISTDEPLPPGEEPELEYKLKPHLEGIQFSRQPPVQRGSDLSGLCSVM